MVKTYLKSREKKTKELSKLVKTAITLSVLSKRYFDLVFPTSKTPKENTTP